MNKAIKVWGQMNVKDIGFGEIEDFLMDQDMSDLSKVFEQNDIFTFWLAILGIIRVKNIGRFTLTFCR